MEKDKNITTKEDFEFFKKECEKFILLLGLVNYEITIEHENQLEGNEYLAYCCTNSLSHYKAGIVLVKEWGYEPVNNYNLSTGALHEVLHILLHRMKSIAETRYVESNEIHESEHEVINRICNLYSEINGKK